MKFPFYENNFKKIFKLSFMTDGTYLDRNHNREGLLEEVHGHLGRGARGLGLAAFYTLRLATYVYFVDQIDLAKMRF